jgi:hypothetical protein
MFKRGGRSVDNIVWKILSAVDGVFCAARSASAQRSTVTCGTCASPPSATARISARVLHSPHGVASCHGSGWGKSTYETFCVSLNSRKEAASLTRRSPWCALSERRASADRVRRGSTKRYNSRGAQVGCDWRQQREQILAREIVRAFTHVVDEEQSGRAAR